MITQTSDVVADYNNGYTLQKLHAKYGIYPEKLKKLLRNANVTLREIGALSRKYTVDHTYFDIIDSAEKAYFLGLLYADGCNYERSSSVQIQLQKRDCAVLELLNKGIKNQRPIKYFTRTTKSGEVKEYGMLRIHSKQLSKRLFELGCVYKKSAVLTAPPVNEIPEKFKNSFILGFFDGDGTIPYYKKCDQYSMTFICNNLFQVYIENILKNELGLHVTNIIRMKKKTSQPLHMLTVGSIPGMAKLINWLRSSATDTLQIERKKERMDNVLKKMETYITPSERGRLIMQKMNKAKI